MSYDPLSDLEQAVEDFSTETNTNRLSQLQCTMDSIDDKLGRILLHLAKITEVEPGPGEGVE